MSENFRTRLRDPWNLRALTHTQTEGTELEHGAPREQGHYAFMLTDLYLLPLLSGVYVDRAKPGADQTLQIDPMFAPPFTVPVLLAGCEASLRAATVAGGSGTQFTLRVAFGQLQLPAGSLRVCGVAHAGAVDIVESDDEALSALSWTQADVSGCKWSP